MRKITLGGGCFWCIEAVFSELKGVEKATSGYAGGDGENPSYEEICSGTTGHAEVVQVEYDPDVISLREILQVFFTVHDPTTLNRQGADVGTQYRSIVLYNDGEERRTTEEVMEELQEEGLWGRPFVTELRQLDRFYPAEDYHQNYFKNNPEKAYCKMVIEPKVLKFRKRFTDKLRQ